MSYNSVGVLGRGGSGVVELAVDSEGRRVATKRVALTGSAEQIRVARQRLRREAEILGRLAHPGIVPILDVINDGDELVLVLPAFPENLEDRVSRLGPLLPDEVARIGRALIAALAAAHRHGVVHRDIKPANVLFDESGEPALADFGMALTWQLTAGLTQPGLVVGTPMWMAPEQARGEQPGPASDVYSLAATLVFASTGHGISPPGSGSIAVARARRRQTRSVLRGVAPSLRLPLAPMLDSRPDRRPSAAALLGGVEGTGSVPATPRRDGPVRRLTRRMRFWSIRLLGEPADRPAGPLRRRLAWTSALLLGMVVAGVVALSVSGRGSPPAPHTSGHGCDPGWYNLDGNTSDGCEAQSDYVAGTQLIQGEPLHANLVPLSASDSFMTRVSGSLLNLCWGSLHVTLTAPPATAEQLTVWKGSEKVATALSANATPATAVVHKPSCFHTDNENLKVTVAVVAATGGASATDFTLSRDGGW